MPPERVREIYRQIEHLQDRIKQDLQTIKTLRKQIAERREQIKQLKEERRKLIFSKFEKARER